MHLKIFFDDKPVYITDTLKGKLKDLSEKKDVIFLKEATNILTVGRTLARDQQSAAVILVEDLKKADGELFGALRTVEAAGGIVQNENKEILFIFRRGKWDLPKGKKEKNETAEACAAREIKEETGVGNLKLKKKIGETRHLYREKGKDILKLNHWFYFTCTGKQITVPQTSEEITEVKWVSTAKIKEPMDNTYSSIRDIMQQFFDEP